MSESRHETTLRQSGMTDKSPSAVEPKPKGGSVSDEPTRTQVGEQAPTIGPRSA